MFQCSLTVLRTDRNIDRTYDFLQYFRNIFQPKEDEFLKDWLGSGKRWNEGKRLIVKHYET